MHPLRPAEAGDLATTTTAAGAGWSPRASEKEGDKTMKPGIGNGKRRTATHRCEWRKNGNSPARNEIYLKCWICNRSKWVPVAEAAAMIAGDSPITKSAAEASPSPRQTGTLAVLPRPHRHIWQLKSTDVARNLRYVECLECGFGHWVRLPMTAKGTTTEDDGLDSQIKDDETREVLRLARKHDVRCEVGPRV